ncbi:MAG: SDR family NAD(P)-dependent oxidoreductase, partial [Deltaproteobacteria bacterium]|nr:SDR family NAD(P)-dependent oxidoreductase [Deltaproteobacteria bacterium]
RSGASVVIAGSRPQDLERIALVVNAAGGEGMATVAAVNLGNASEVQALFDGLPRIDLLAHFTGSVDWKRPLLSLSFEEWSAAVDRFGYIPRRLTWQAERRMDKDGTDGTIVIVGPDMSGIPSIGERNFVQIFQAMLRPAVATEAMERALMRKAQADGTAPAHVSDVNIGLILPGRNDGRNRSASPSALAATVLWLAGTGKPVSGAVLLPDEQNSLARLRSGGIRNLGKEISLRFAAERATVVAASRRPRTDGPPGDAEKARTALREADAVLARMRESGGRAIWLDVDIANPRRVRALIEETRNRFGRIDAFVNNAGAGGDFSLVGDVLRGHRASWDAVLRANFLGPWAAVSFLKGIMGSRPEGGTIVNVSTHYADHPYPYRTIYTVSKILLKALTQALRDPLASTNIHIVDVAPSLIAGPRMDWVMRNYADRFAGQFDAVGDLAAAERKNLAELFLRSLDRGLSSPDRSAAAAAFLSAVRDCRLPKGSRAELESWYGRVRDWFRATVPDDPPTNEEVAETVLHAAKNARFLEDRFLGVSTLGRFATFPGEPVFSRKTAIKGDPVVMLSAGGTDKAAAARQALAAALSRAGASLTAVVESPARPGKVDISRPIPGSGGARRERGAEPAEREIDLSDPRVLESWLDNSLLGMPPPAGAVVFVGAAAEREPILARSSEEMDAFLVLVGKALNMFAEACRAVRQAGHVVLVAPRPDGGEGILLRAALRQIARTALAEMRLLPSGRKVALSLVTAPAPGGEQEFARAVLDLLAGRSPSFVEAIPVGHERP